MSVWTFALVFCLTPSLAMAQSSGGRPGRIDGMVYDSIARRPLANATIQLLRSEGITVMRTAVADSIGRFRFDSVDAGEWTMGVVHPRLDSVGVTQLARRTTVQAGKRRSITMAVPSSSMIVRRLCGDSTVANSLGVVFGTVRRATLEQAGVPATVRFSWTEVEFRDQQFVERGIIFDQTASETGEYIACGVPADARFTVQAGAGPDSSGVIEVLPGNNGVQRLDLFVGPTARRQDTSIVTPQDSTETVTDTVVTPYLVGVGRVEGSVRRGGNGVPGARVTVWGTGREVRSQADGSFSLAGIPIGTHTLEVRAIGFEPVRRSIDVLPGESTTIPVDLSRYTPLDTVRVRAWATRNQGRFNEAEFFKRRNRGGGVLLSPQDLAKLNPITMQQVLSQAGWVSTKFDRDTGQTVSMGTGLFRCTPLLILDGREVDQEEFFQTILPDRLLAIEIYRRSSTPAEFSRPQPCGSIIAWTGDRPPIEVIRK